MKVTFDIECTPDEARAFLGLPDVVPMQDALMKQLQAKLSENIRSLDPETLAKTWVPLTMQSWGEMQKAFWAQMGTGATRGSAPTSPFTMGGMDFTPRPASSGDSRETRRPQKKTKR